MIARCRRFVSLLRYHRAWSMPLGWSVRTAWVESRLGYAASIKRALDAAAYVLYQQRQMRDRVDAERGSMPEPSDVREWAREDFDRNEEARRRLRRLHRQNPN